MAGFSGANVVVTPGIDAQNEIVTPSIDAPTGRATVFILRQLLFFCGWDEEQTKNTNRQKGTKQAEEMKKGEPEDHQEHSTCHQSADRQVVPRSQDRSPKVKDLENAKCEGEKEMKEVKAHSPS
ncbi:hypothetical protein H5410_004303, partial [Solanum commersonii]